MVNTRHKTLIFTAVILSFLAASAQAVSPKVIKTLPENRDRNVDPSLKQIRIEFDQDMNRGGYSICGGGPKYPETSGKPKWISKRTLVMPVKLKANQEYELSINCQSYKNFKNLQGQPAVIYPLKFKTGASGNTVSPRSSISTKSPSILLQEGLYAEETLGDLDKAIDIYDRVLLEAEDVERIAARASYQLGLCYLKKGRQSKAAKYFQKVTTNYPNERTLASRARIQLKKLSFEIGINDRPFIVWFKPADTEAITDARQLLDAFNARHPKDASTFRYRTETNAGTIVGRICTFNGQEKSLIVEMIKTGRLLELVKTEPAYTIIFKSAKSTSVDDKQLLDMFNKNHPRDVETYRYQTNFKDGSTVGYISTDTKNEKDKLVNMLNQSSELLLVDVIGPEEVNGSLENIKPEAKESVFEQLDYQVTRFLGEEFGKTAFEAGQQHLLVNSHIYYVDLNGYRYSGGMNSFYNWTGRTISQKTSFGGTSYPNQTHYGLDGQELNTEIVPDKTRKNHWQIYWIPDEPLAPEEHLYYGWSRNDRKKLSQLPGDVYSLEMQNMFGDSVIETFFLVLPKELEISQSNPPTGSQELLNSNVYWWTKTVRQGENHVERVHLRETPTLKYSRLLEKPISVNEEKSPDGHKLAVQYAVIAVCEKARVPYKWDKSAELADPQRRNFIEPIDVQKKPAKEILKDILQPAGLTYGLDDDGLYLKKLALEKIKTTASKADKLFAEELTVEGWKLWGQRKLVEAEEKFKQATEKDTTNDNAYQGLGWAQLNQGKKLNAKTSFEKCIAINPNNSAALNGLGWIAHGQGNFDEAIEWWENAVEASNGYATASLSGLTQVYMEREQFDTAVKYFQMWIKAEPNNKQAKDGLQKARDAAKIK